MSDLRDFTYTRDDSAPRFADSPAVLREPIRDDVVIVDDGGLRDLHISHEAEDEQGRRKTLFGGLAVALVVGIGAAWGVSLYLKDQPVVADKDLPSPSAPTNTAAMTPPPKPAPLETAPEAATATEAVAPAAPDTARPALPTRQADVANASKMRAAPQAATPALPPASEQYTAPAVTAPIHKQASNMPEPVSPTPPASALAGNPPLNEQSAPSPDEALAAPAPAQPEAAAPAPAPVESVPAQ